MAKRIIFNQLGHENIQIVTPISDAPEHIELALEKAVRPNTDQWFIVEDSDIPSDRHFRNAWKIKSDNKGVDVDLPKAQAMTLERIRSQRNAALDATDKEMAKLTEQGKNAEANALKVKRQILRDLPAVLNLSGMTAEELKNYDPVSEI